MVDDSAIARRELCHSLAQAGFKVATAAEGGEELFTRLVSPAPHRSAHRDRRQIVL